MKIFEETILKKHPNRVVFENCTSCVSCVSCVRISLGVVFDQFSPDLSTSSVHSSITKDSIFLNPEALSCLNDERVPASYLLEGEEVEVRQLMPGEVEVVPHPSVKVVPHRPPVLCAPLSAGPCVSHLTHILSRLCSALPCPM